MEQVRDLDAHLDGVLGICVIDLNTGRSLSYHGETVFAQASSIKIPILIELFHQARAGKFHLTDPITLEPREAVGGSGELQRFLRTRSMTLTIEELTKWMIQSSDNTATNKLIALVGMENVNTGLERFGLHSTRLQRVMLDTAAAEKGQENVSSPKEMAQLMELIYRGKAGDQDDTKRMLEILSLPDADFRKSVPANTRVAAKPGWVPGVHTETGIIFVPNRPFILSVAAAFLDSANPVPEIAKLFYNHYARLAKSNAYGNGSVR